MNKNQYFEEILKTYIKDGCITLAENLSDICMVDDFAKKTSIEKEIKKKNHIDSDRLQNSTNTNQDLEIYKKLENCKTISNIKALLNTKDILSTDFFLNRFAKNLVIGDGIETAKILLIGEAPGETEDEMGIPFCGKSGQLLEKALAAIDLKRDRNIYITNTVFWRPEDNRKPTEKELQFCLPFLRKIIEIINPKIIITSGAVSTGLLLKTEQAISGLIGKISESKITFFNNKTIKCFPIYHPSYLLRNPSSKKILWENLLILKYFLKSTS